VHWSARVAFDVELDAALERLQQRRDLAHVIGGDVAGIGARVHGDAGAARGDAGAHGFGDRRHASAARVADRRHLVDVDR
jgi:hypothetical protein